MNRRTIRAALLAFLLSRAVFFALVITGSNVAFIRKIYNDRIWAWNVPCLPMRDLLHGGSAPPQCR